MSTSRTLPSRRVLAVVAVVIAAGLALAGAFAFGLVGAGSSPLDQVPGEADVVATIDPAVASDPGTRALGDAALERAGFGSIDAATAITALQIQTGLSAGDVQRAVVYTRSNPSGRIDPTYVGAVVHANWSTDAVVDGIARTTGVAYREDTVDGLAVYRPQRDAVTAPTVAVLADGEFAIGTDLAVEDAVAVETGDIDAVSGPLRGTLANTEPGLVTVAAEVPSAWLEAFEERTRGLTRLGSVSALAATYDTTDDAIVLRGRLHTGSDEAARDVAAVTRGGLPVAASRIDDETTAALLGDVVVERDGSDVRLRLETTVAELQRLAAAYDLGGN